MCRRLSAWLICTVCMAACTRDFEPEPNPDYFPLAKGRFWEYAVQETRYAALTAPVTDSYRLRIVVTDSILSAEGGYLYVLYRFVRHDSDTSWQYLNTWSARKYAGYALVAEGNTLYAKLAFPVHVNRLWNGNLFNHLAEDTYRITQLISEEELTTGLLVKDIVEIEQENVTNNLTYRDVRKEWYAHNVGLVRKQSEVWNYRCNGGTCTGEIESGYAWQQTLITFGRE